jgi:hypothetical protein
MIRLDTPFDPPSMRRPPRRINESKKDPMNSRQGIFDVASNVSSQKLTRLAGPKFCQGGLAGPGRFGHCFKELRPPHRLVLPYGVNFSSPRSRRTPSVLPSFGFMHGGEAQVTASATQSRAAVTTPIAASMQPDPRHAGHREQRSGGIKDDLEEVQRHVIRHGRPVGSPAPTRQLIAEL